MQKIRWFLLIVGILMALVLAWQNSDTATVQLLWFEQTMPLSALLLSTIAVGFLLGSLLTAAMLRRKKRKTKENEKSQPETESVENRQPAEIPEVSRQQV